MVRDLKFQIKVVEGLYYLYSENKGADQWGLYRASDLRLGFFQDTAYFFPVKIRPCSSVGIFFEIGQSYSHLFRKQPLVLRF